MAYEYINATGVIIPDTSQNRQEVEDEWKALFGADLIIDPESPEGLFITQETLQRDAIAINNADLANQINPNLAGGVFLDAIFSFTNGRRASGQPSVFTAAPDLTGVPGTFIPEGTLARTVNGDLFQSTADLTLDGVGQGSVGFQSVDDDKIQVGIGELNQIETPVLGWETITNTVAATPGQSQESDQAARRRRRQTLAAQGRSTPEATISNVLNVEDVQSVSFRENVSNSAQLIDNVNMVPHSIFVCVEGGLDSDVAAAILNAKSSGSNYNGSTTVAVTEPASGQVYDVKFERPDVVGIEAQLTVSAGSSVQDPETAVKEAILRYADGEIDGEQGFVIDGDVSPFELAGAVNIESPEILVRSCAIRKTGDPSFLPVEIPIEVFEIASITDAAISVTVV